MREGALVLRALHSSRPETRFGFAVGQAVGKAVVRNRVKRRLREAARSLPVEEGWDIVVNARPNAAQAGFRELRAQLERLLARAGALRANEETEER